MFSVAFLVTFLCSSILAPARNTNAETVTESSSASGYTLSLSATPVVNLNVGVLEVPVMTVGVGTVSTSTTAPGGYKLYLSMAGTSNDLRRTGSDGDTISATTGTMADSSALGIGEWGYAIPSTTPNISATDFDTSYDIMESAYPSSKGFAAPPISTATAELITSTNSPNTTANDISVYYGINADDTTPLGNYTGSVLWTALADSADTPSANVSPSSGATIGGETITVTTTLFTTSVVDAHIYMKQGASSTEMTCNRTSYTPLTYTCTTPEKPAGEYEIYVDIPRYEKTYTADFTYFVQPEFFRVSNMQDMTGLICTSATIPSASAQYEDTTGIHSGDTNYVPTMTLTDTRGATPYKTYTVKRLADGKCWMTQNLALENATLDSTNTNLPDGATSSVTASSTQGWCKTADVGCINRFGVMDSGRNDYGIYYNWFTATLGYGNYAVTGDTNYSICPKGWHLPKQNSSSGDFSTLKSTYSNAEAVKNPIGPNFVLSGWYGADGPDNQGNRGYYWSSTANANIYTNAVYIDSIFTTNYNSAYKYFGFTVRCVANTPLDDISNMQDMTNEICSNTLIGESKTLKDTRDNSTYTVKKLNDGRCWMTQNLRLVGPISASNLNSTNTNVASGSTFALTASNSNAWCTTNSSACNNQSMMLDSGNNNYGAYYNWYAATAGTGKYETTTDTSYSICPKGWRLPKGGSSGEFQTLYGKYGSSALMRDANGPNFILAGHRYRSSTYDASTYGLYWSSTAYGNDYAYYLSLNSSNVNPANYNDKYLGFTVRCINAN